MQIIQILREQSRVRRIAPPFFTRRKDNRGAVLTGIRDWMIFLIAAEGAVALLSVLCYDDLRWMLPLQALLPPACRIVQKQKSRRRRRLHIQGFREVLQSLMTSLQAGYSMENACRVCLEEIGTLCGSDRHPTVEAFRRIVRGIALHDSVEQLFMEYAREAQVEEIREFAMVLQIAKSTGGNLVDVVKNAMEHLQSRMDASEELQVSLSGRLFEKNIMLLMPLGVLLYLRLANPAYLEGLYHRTAGNILMTGVIGGTVLCFFWTERIMDIRF